MRLEKLVKVSQKHADQMYNIVLERYNRELERFLKRQRKEKK